MSTLYIFDAHTNPISGSDLNEVRYNAISAPMTGHFIVRVPADMPLAAEQQTLANVLSEKYNATLAYFSTFADIVYEDFTQTPGVDSANSPGTTVGIRCTTKIGRRIGGVGGVLQTNMTVLGGAPSVISVTWEAFRVVNTNPVDGRLTQEFQEASPGDLTVEASFNNGATWTSVTDRAIQNIAGPDQGTDLVLRFTNATGPSVPVWLGSWAVLF
jgi:hypothetical protein